MGYEALEQRYFRCLVYGLCDCISLIIREYKSKPSLSVQMRPLVHLMEKEKEERQHLMEKEKIERQRWGISIIIAGVAAIASLITILCD